MHCCCYVTASNSSPYLSSPRLHYENSDFPNCTSILVLSFASWWVSFQGMQWCHAQCITYNFAYVSFSVLVCPSVLAMSFPALCADSVHLPGMLTCHAVLLSLLKKSGKAFVTLFPRFPPPWPTPLRRWVFDAMKIATSLMVYFLQRWFHHRWQNHGTIFLTKIEPESPRAPPVC
jgi:hypothetical protein